MIDQPLDAVEREETSRRDKNVSKADATPLAKNNPDNPYAASGGSIFDFLRAT